MLSKELTRMLKDSQEVFDILIKNDYVLDSVDLAQQADELLSLSIPYLCCSLEEAIKWREFERALKHMDFSVNDEFVLNDIHFMVTKVGGQS